MMKKTTKTDTDKKTALSERELLAVQILMRNRFKDAEGNLPIGHKDGDKLNNCVENLEWIY